MAGEGCRCLGPPPDPDTHITVPQRSKHSQQRSIYEALEACRRGWPDFFYLGNTGLSLISKDEQVKDQKNLFLGNTDSLCKDTGLLREGEVQREFAILSSVDCAKLSWETMCWCLRVSIAENKNKQKYHHDQKSKLI